MPEHQAPASQLDTAEPIQLQRTALAGNSPVSRSARASVASVALPVTPHRLANISAARVTSAVLQPKKMLAGAPPSEAAAARPGWQDAAWARTEWDDAAAEEAPEAAPEEPDAAARPTSGASSSSGPAASSSAPAPSPPTRFRAEAIPGTQAGTSASLWVQPTHKGHHLSVECRRSGDGYEVVGGHLTDESIPEGTPGRRVREASEAELDEIRKRAAAKHEELERAAAAQRQQHAQQKQAAAAASEKNAHVKAVRGQLHSTVSPKVSDPELHAAVERGWRHEHLAELKEREKGQKGKSKASQDPVQLARVAPSASGAIVQRQLKVDVSNRDYVDKVTGHLRELVGHTGDLEVHPETGLVSLNDRHPEASDEDRTHGHRLLHSLVQHAHTTTIRETQGADKLSSQPVLPDNSRAGKVLDWFKGFQAMRKRGFLTHEARAFVNGATPGKGVGTIVHYDANLTEKERESEVQTPDGVKRQAAPASISLGHELIHSDHFHRGTAAYDFRGTPILSSRQHTYSKFSRGETTNLEEINTVGLDVLPQEHEFHKHIVDLGLAGPQTYQDHLQDRDIQARQVTEQDLRDQLKVPRRAGYER